jgi:hypothetical protein
MGARENKVERYLDDQVKQCGGLTRKWVSPGRDGVPDRIVVYDGEIHLVEVKTTDGELSEVQEREHKRIRDKGVLVHTVYGHTGIDSFIKIMMMTE